MTQLLKVELKSISFFFFFSLIGIKITFTCIFFKFCFLCFLFQLSPGCTAIFPFSLCSQCFWDQWNPVLSLVNTSSFYFFCWTQQGWTEKKNGNSGGGAVLTIRPLVQQSTLLLYCVLTGGHPHHQNTPANSWERWDPAGRPTSRPFSVLPLRPKLGGFCWTNCNIHGPNSTRNLAHVY